MNSLRMVGSFARSVGSTFSETGFLPAGVTFTNAGVLSGTPGAGAGGAYVITITATNGSGGTQTDKVRFTVAGENAFTIAVMPDTQDYTTAAAINAGRDAFFGQINLPGPPTPRIAHTRRRLRDTTKL